METSYVNSYYTLCPTICQVVRISGVMCLGGLQMPGMAFVEASKPTVEIARALLLPKPTSRGLGLRPQASVSSGETPGDLRSIQESPMSYSDVIAPETGHSWGSFLGDSVVGWHPGRGLCQSRHTGNALDGEHLVQGDLRGCR